MIGLGSKVSFILNPHRQRGGIVLTLRSVVTADLDATQTMSPCSCKTSLCTVPLLPSATSRFPAASTTICLGCCRPVARRLTLYPVPILGLNRWVTLGQLWAAASDPQTDTARAPMPANDVNGAMILR